MSLPAHVVPSASSRDRRTLVRGCVCIVLILLVGKGMPAWRRATGAVSTGTTAARAQLARDERLIGERRRTSEALDRRTTALIGLSAAFFKGRSPDEGAAALAAQVSDAAAENGVHLGSLQPHADSAPNALLVPISVSTSGTGDIRGIEGMLRDLESSAPLVDVRQLTVSQPDPAAPTDRMEMLHVEITVRGMFRRLPSDDE